MGFIKFINSLYHKDLDLYCSNITTIDASLESSKKVNKLSKRDLEIKDSLVDCYAKRAVYKDKFMDIMELNFIEFSLNYEPLLKSII